MSYPSIHSVRNSTDISLPEVHRKEPAIVDSWLLTTVKITIFAAAAIAIIANWILLPPPVALLSTAIIFLIVIIANDNLSQCIDIAIQEGQNIYNDASRGDVFNPPIRHRHRDPSHPYSRILPFPLQRSSTTPGAQRDANEVFQAGSLNAYIQLGNGHDQPDVPTVRLGQGHRDDDADGTRSLPKLIFTGLEEVSPQRYLFKKLNSRGTYDVIRKIHLSGEYAEVYQASENQRMSRLRPTFHPLAHAMSPQPDAPLPSSSPVTPVPSSIRVGLGHGQDSASATVGFGTGHGNGNQSAKSSATVIAHKISDRRLSPIAHSPLDLRSRVITTPTSSPTPVTPSTHVGLGHNQTSGPATTAVGGGHH